MPFGSSFEHVLLFMIDLPLPYTAYEINLGIDFETCGLKFPVFMRLSLIISLKIDPSVALYHLESQGGPQVEDE